MSLHIIAVGKKHESWVAEGIERYQKRLKAPFEAEWILMAHSSFDGPQARQDESGRILSRLANYDVVILLDERGKQLTSPAFAELLETHLNQSQKVVIIIGGAYGVTPELRQKAQVVWSLSDLVFPHQLVRLMLTEQLYRAQQITISGAYHHQ